MNYETVIGLEIHAQLATNSKIFSGAPTTFGAPPNTQACAVDLGLPGVLPVVNEAAIRMAVKFGLAVNGTVAPVSVFARKNYFYPDLPKGYQLSQFELPIVSGGHIDIELADGSMKRVALTRAHLEEDAGKSLHEDFQGMSGIDLNRAGTPLIEIVSEPDMRSAKEAAAYMRHVHMLVRYLGICDGNMQEGSLRCDANVSVRPQGQTKLGTRTELKNLNSFRFIERAINYEVERQIDVIESGGTVVQQTRLYDPDAHETRAMRSKEEANDYRYFPDPDLLPVELDEAYIEAIRKTLPELPDARSERFATQYGLAAREARQLTADKPMADYFEAAVLASAGHAKLCANWLNGELAAALNRTTAPFERSPINAQQLGQLVARIEDGTISGKIAKQIFELMWDGGGTPDALIEKHGLRQVTDSGAIEALIDEILAANPDQVQQFKGGNAKVLGFFVGQVMKRSMGKANPKQVNELLRARLN
ncbi:MAG: Asp-tRNA(Asn)/Glu-tRNA(Gln) amidotransferase subunit GatB [Chromatiales bacterium]|nr:Asp-tRNA(Asn)/Glu-tRNA(Gln) amidotransferase subunit GatB [Chromatiales bacterium]